jgi:hypothetical protein
MCTFNFNNNLENPYNLIKDILGILGISKQCVTVARDKIHYILSNDSQTSKNSNFKPIGKIHSKHPLAKALRFKSRVIPEFSFFSN